MITTVQIETRSSVIDKLDLDILRIARKEGVDMKIQDLQEIGKVYNELLQTQPAKLLVILDEACTSEIGFMEKMGSVAQQKMKKAEALIVKSLGKRLEANFYIRKFKPNHPVAVFKTEEEGLEWLQTIE